MNLADIINIIFIAFLSAAFLMSIFYFAITFIGMLHTKQKSSDDEIIPDEDLPLVTIQIPTYNEIAAINCATCCLKFDYPCGKMQIIIGDDSDKAEVSQKIDQFLNKNEKIEISRRGGNHGYKPGNLNAMLPKSKGEYILILDSDFLPEKDFLKKIISPAIRDPELSGVQAGWKVLNIHQNFNTLIGGSIINIMHTILMPFMHKITGHVIFCGSAELIRKSDLIDLGGWTEGSLTEDVDYSLRLIAKGKKISYAKNLKVMCEAPYTSLDLFRQQMRWAYGVVSAFLKHHKKVFRSKITNGSVKLAALIFSSGYIMIAILLFTFFFGMLNIICGALGFDPSEGASASYTLAHGIYDSVINIILTGGMILAAIIAGFINGFTIKNIFRLFIALITVGFICMFFVGKGIFSACAGMPMKWHMLKKLGNEQQI